MLQASTILFALSTLAGILVGPSIFPNLIPLLRQAILPASALRPLELAGFVFANNAAKMLAMILGGLVVGVLPGVFLVANGAILGMVMREGAERFGSLFILAAILPHGLIEIPLLIFTASRGFLVGRQVLRKLRGTESELMGRLKDDLWTYVKIILPALLVAALIEVFVTPLFASLFTLG